MTTRRIKVSAEERFWAKVEKSDSCWLWVGSTTQGGYGMFKMTRSRVPKTAHRVAYTFANGEDIPKGMHLDHTCHNRACVNLEHLRVTTPKQNGENRGGLPSSNTSGVLGVSWSKGTSKWRADVRHQGKQIHVGRFDSIEDAEAAVIAKRNELFTHNDLDRRAA